MRECEWETENEWQRMRAEWENESKISIVTKVWKAQRITENWHDGEWETENERRKMSAREWVEESKINK